jgi:hypothetical protein
VVRALALVAVATAVLGCKPDFGTPASLVTGPRILAVRAEPAEVRAAGTATFTALVVSPNGTDAAPAVDWSLCLTPKPLDENNVVATACLGDKGLTPVATATPTATATVPANACALFGPDPPPQMQGQPPLRPRDPDITGGYYQPLRLVDGEVTGFALERVTCDLAQAGADLAVAYAMTYQANVNPTLQPLTATVNGGAVALDAIPAGATVDFATGWPPEAVESFPVFDLDIAALITHRESMRVSWFGSDGAFLHEVTGRDEADSATTTDNTWTAPSAPGTVHLWLVLRDSRGGVAFAAYDVVVVP